MTELAMLWGTTLAERSPGDDNGPEQAWKIVEPCGPDCGHPVHAFSVPKGTRHLEWFDTGSAAVQRVEDSYSDELAEPRDVHGDDTLRDATEAMREQLRQRFTERGMSSFMAEQFAALLNVRLASVVIEWLAAAHQDGIRAAADAVRIRWTDDETTARRNEEIAAFIETLGARGA